ncbi:MAG: class I SAM-dependent methyltransferase [Okeania sp. SIO3I5]|nr:class I SAM-dependent methyltransferase [Okeania sp. SIO3I5]
MAFLSKEKIYKLLNEKNGGQRYVARKLFNLFQSLGFHVVGDHFYEIIPNTKEIHKKYHDKPRNLPFLEKVLPKAEAEIVSMLEKWGYEFYETSTKYGYKEKNYYFSGVDAIALYCLIRDWKPKRIIEIGQGSSTSVFVSAISKNYQETQLITEFISIDPYNRFEFQEIEGVKFVNIRDSLQNVSKETFLSLDESDFLFVDSSHVYKFGSDVEYLFEEIYPQIKPGVNIHIHDIFSPYHYPLSWYVKEKRFWNEQYYLELFMQFNSKFNVTIPIYFMTRNSNILKEKCQSICTYENFKFAGNSLYLRRVS